MEWGGGVGGVGPGVPGYYAYCAALMLVQVCTLPDGVGHSIVCLLHSLSMLKM